MSPRILRRDKALSAIESAVESVDSAIVALGGRTRQRSVKKNLRLFTVRQYLEGISSRLHVCLDLLQVDAVVSGRFPVDPERKVGMSPLHAAPYDMSKPITGRSVESTTLDDPFEDEYNRERSPGC